MAKTTGKAAKNFLDFIPVHNPDCKFTVDENRCVTILRENKGLINRIAQKLLGQPKVSQIHLDEIGNFLWPLIDGKRTVLDLSVLVKEKYGDKAEPLYNRLVPYIRTLEEYGFIQMRP